MCLIILMRFRVKKWFKKSGNSSNGFFSNFTMGNAGSKCTFLKMVEYYSRMYLLIYYLIISIRLPSRKAFTVNQKCSVKLLKNTARLPRLLKNCLKNFVIIQNSSISYVHAYISVQNTYLGIIICQCAGLVRYKHTLMWAD